MLLESSNESAQKFNSSEEGSGFPDFLFQPCTQKKKKKKKKKEKKR